MNGDSALAYLRQALAIDPIAEPHRLLALRARWLSGATGSSASHDRPTRKELLELQDELVGVFWTLDQGEVAERLATFAAEPDLERWGRRLAALDGDRAAFAALEGDGEVPPLMVRAIHEVALEPGAKTAVAYQERARGLPRHEAGRAALWIEATHPVVHGHVRGFFDQLVVAHDPKRASRQELTLLAALLALACLGGVIWIWWLR